MRKKPNIQLECLVWLEGSINFYFLIPQQQCCQLQPWDSGPRMAITKFTFAEIIVKNHFSIFGKISKFSQNVCTNTNLGNIFENIVCIWSKYWFFQKDSNFLRLFFILKLLKLLLATLPFQKGQYVSFTRIFLAAEARKAFQTYSRHSVYYYQLLGLDLIA
jgi:hypothetical protein